MQTTIQQYLHALESSNAEQITQLFSDDGIVHSPLYGNMSAKDFYKDLFSDTHQSKITILNIFSSLNNATVYAAHFIYDWVLLNGNKTKFECIDIFHFDEAGKITEMTIIYDTNITREAFDKRS